jgi:hypothetical protein
MREIHSTSHLHALKGLVRSFLSLGVFPIEWDPFPPRPPSCVTTLHDYEVTNNTPGKIKHNLEESQNLTLQQS